MHVRGEAQSEERVRCRSVGGVERLNDISRMGGQLRRVAEMR